MGRKDSYRADMPERVLELKGAGAALIDIAYELGITETTLYRLGKKYPELQTAIVTQPYIWAEYPRSQEVIGKVQDKRQYLSYSNKRHYSATAGRINSRVSGVITWVMKGTKGKTIRHYLGVSREELRDHIESLFVDGMNWGNYGTTWQVNHINDPREFNIQAFHDAEFKKCWSLSNLKPMLSK